MKRILHHFIKFAFIAAPSLVLVSCASNYNSLPLPEVISDDNTIIEEFTPLDDFTNEIDESELNLDPPEIPIEMLREEESIKEEPFNTTLSNAVEKATVSSPKKTDFKGSIATYDYISGYVYTIYCSPGIATDVRLESGEELLSDPIVGDNSRWQFVGVSSSENGSPIQHIFIRPTVSEISTNVTLVTNKRTYYLKLISFDSIYMIGVEFRYFDTKSLNIAKNAINITNVENLNFDFQIEGNMKNPPLWKPTSAYTDGTKTYIVFPKNFSTTSASPTAYFLKDYRNDKDIALTNYQVKGNRYIISTALERGNAILLLNEDQKVKVIKL